MYLNLTNPYSAVSVTPMDPILKFWDLKTFQLVKSFTTKDIFSISVLPIDDRYVLIWDSNKNTVFTLDCIDGKIIANTEGNLGDYPPSLYMKTWVLLKCTNELLMFDEKRKFLQIFDWKTGKNFSL